ncbi:DUF3558 domain-containing protein [Amycolatopsis sp. OK19-0408]|uniref:DUF3558 domain-containing protein n=1 Tax=Amycolatopsis iheyensis TaxID=2945988 RepID=A0A9X2SK34_9PSEU|nr:DUF3558 domain-containing protein [Amycolatopsis iheyensis]MCR6483446.1 DUF3558 domain-containing protein [Amycolatopsis iheyensis]
MNRRAAAAGVAVLALAVITSCSPSPPPAPTEPSMDVPPIPGTGLAGTARFRADPCSAVTVEQLNSLGFTGGDRSVDGNRCVTKFGPVASVDTVNRDNSLRTLYLEHARGHDTGNHWEPITIDTVHPAVIVTVDDNVPSKQADGPLGCTLALAADDSTLIYITAATYDKPEAGPWQHDPCGAAQKIAEVAARNLRT